MNKIIKLPLFLGVVGGLCGGLLALTNAVTAGKIQKDEQERIAAAYKVHFANIASSENVQLNDTLTAAGVTAKVNAFDAASTKIGSIYTATVKGFAGDVTFTVSFADNQIKKFIQIAGGETAQGAAFITAFSKAENITVDKMADYRSGSSVTYGAVTAAINVCYADYVA